MIVHWISLRVVLLRMLLISLLIIRVRVSPMVISTAAAYSRRVAASSIVVHSERLIKSRGMENPKSGLLVMSMGGGN